MSTVLSSFDAFRREADARALDAPPTTLHLDGVLALVPSADRDRVVSLAVDPAARRVHLEVEAPVSSHDRARVWRLVGEELLRSGTVAHVQLAFVRHDADAGWVAA